MDKGKKFLILVLLIIVLFPSTNTVWSQKKDTLSIFSYANLSVKSEVSPDDILEKSQRNLDRSIGILNVVATLMSVLVGLITIILIIAGYFGFFEFRRWKQIRQQVERNADESKKTAGEATSIVEGLKRAKEEANKILESIGEIPLFKDSMSEDVKEKLDEFGKRIELLELLGFPLKPEDYFARATDFYYKGNFELALVALNKAIELKPDFADAWYNKGIALVNLEKYDDAIKCYDEAIKINPIFADAWNNKGIAFGFLGKYTEEVECYDEAIKINPNYAEAWYNKGIALVNLEKYDDAIKCYDEAIKINQNYTKAWNNKGVLLENLNRYDEAIECYDEALKIDPNYDKALYNKACVFSLKGDKESALKNLSMAIKLDPGNKEKAKKDEDFKNLWEDEDFKRVVE